MGGHHHHHHHHLPDRKLEGEERYKAMRKVTLVGSVVDALLAVAKLLAGYAANSQALIADGVHSLSDLATDVMVIVAAKHGSQDADEKHPYGHGRFETLATVILGVALIGVAAGIAWDSIDRLFNPAELMQPGVWALLIAVISVLSKEWIYRYTMALARKLRSDMLKANAWHSRTDAISSVIVVVGVAGTMAGLEYLDAIAAVGVALMVAKVGFDLVWESLHELVDAGLELERVEAIKAVILEVDGVRELHMLRTRRMGQDALVDVHVLVDPELSVSEGHYISETVRHRLIRKVDEVNDVLVHIDPEDDEQMPLSANLPPRGELLARMLPHWESLGLTQAPKKTTLHYLEGRVIVELYLPCGLVAHDTLKEALEESAEAWDEVAEVRVFYC